ncbi:MAG TPA: hypothetical protein PK961_11650 [bacterium]|nr:hypothetical protein [bacterium]
MYGQLKGLPYEDLDLNNGIPAVELIKRGWGVFFSDSAVFINFLVYFLILMGASAVPMGSLIVTGPLLAGLSYQYLKIVRREKVELNGLFDGFKLFGITLAAYLLFTVIMFGGILLCLVGAIVFSIWYIFLWYILVDGERDIWQCFVKSKSLVEGFGWEIFLFMVIVGLFNMLGVLACLIGVFITAPISMLATAMLYDLMCAHKGRGIRDPEYIRHYWEQQRAAQAPSRPPVVGPIIDAEPVEQFPPRPRPIDLPPETAPTTVQTPPPVEIPASVSEPLGERGDDDDPKRNA